MKYKCVIFDCDGVLVDSEATTISVIVNMAREVGYDMPFDLAMELMTGQSLDYCFNYINARAERLLPSNARDVFRKRTFDAYRKELLPVPGIHHVLEHLNRPCCVASNGPAEKVILNLGLINALHFFDGNVFSAYDINKWKPDPSLFLHAAKKMGFAPSECCVVEDSMSGVRAAKGGGFDVFAYTTPEYSTVFQQEGAYILHDMTDLLNHI